MSNAESPHEHRTSATIQFYIMPLLTAAISITLLSVAISPVLDVIDAILDIILDPLAEVGISEPVLQTMLISALLALSIYITLYSGMFSLANAGFMGIGAYVGAIVTKNFELSFGISILLGTLVTGVIALCISLPVLRLRNIYLAIATIGFGEIVVVFFNRIDAILLDMLRNNQRLNPLIEDLYKFLNVEVRFTTSGTPTRAIITGGASGLKNIPQQTETAHLILFLIFTSYVMYRLQRSRFGRALNAIRQDEKVASSQGINVVYYKNLAFLIGALLAGTAGVFDAHRDTLIEPRDYGFNTAVDILGYAVLGGTSGWAGPILGGLTLQGLPELLRELAEYSGVITGLTLLITIVYLPGGLISLTRLNFWIAGGRFSMAKRIATTGLTIIFIANVFPYQKADTVEGRILGNAFLQDQARENGLVILMLAGAMLLAFGRSMQSSGHWQGQNMIPRSLWQPIGGGISIFILLLISYRELWYLAVGNLLPAIGLLWVLHIPQRDEGSRFSLILGILSISLFIMWLLLGLTQVINDVMLAYYMHLVGLLLLAAACFINYPPLTRHVSLDNNHASA